MRRTSLVLAAAGGAAVLAVTGVALAVQTADGSAPAVVAVGRTPDDDPPAIDDSPTPHDDATTTAPPAGSGAGTAGGTLTRQQAGAVAVARVGGGRIVEIEAETEHARPVWSVKVVRAGVTYEVKVDRGDGTVVEVERKRTDDRGGRVAGRSDDHGTDDRYDDHGDDRYDDHGDDD
ncbi:PepSY domain-containing protein [Micromonospora sp. NPDC048930]|uniref:PepSY domain-containing protein n=1 Tax=Micromonospora sp. NPDC048930 TaxID=3364261 RepID=UPI003721CF48